LYAAIDAASVPVDTHRLYVTGFSYGGNMAFDFPCVYPGRFAASVPVASLQRIGMIPETNPGRYWVLYNEGDFQRYNGDARVAELRDLVVARGGEFRIGSFPADGHNAWDAAWREDRVWDWMFSKTADGRPVRDGRVVARRPEMAAPTTANATPVDAPVTPTAPQRPVCGASRPGQDAKTGPERGADGLDGTWYASGTPMEGNRRDWWTVAYPTPVTGRITVTTGDKTGKGKLSKGDVEVSLDGERWTRVRSFSDGVCSFAQKRPIRHLRVMPLPKTPEVLVIREVTVEP
jgi:hypothetical protein